MSFFYRWLFWIVALAVFAGACFFGFITYQRYAKLQNGYSQTIKSQGEISKYATYEFPTQNSLNKVQALLERWEKDLQDVVLANYNRERETRFEMLFSSYGLTDNLDSIDLNKYRSIYETSRDEVLKRAVEDGKLAFEEKCDKGFQFFEKNAVLSKDTLPLIQKKFWISKAVYDSIIAYNRAPATTEGWKFVEGEGDKPAKIPGMVSMLREITHMGKVQPFDIRKDDARYEESRKAMEAFHYFDLWKVSVSLIAPAGIVPALTRELQKHPLGFRIDSVVIKRIDGEEPDRYAAPRSAIKLNLLVYDFNDKLFASQIPGCTIEEFEKGEEK